MGATRQSRVSALFRFFIFIMIERAYQIPRNQIESQYISFPDRRGFLTPPRKCRDRNVPAIQKKGALLGSLNGIMLVLIFVLSHLLFNLPVSFAVEHKPRYISLAPSTTEILFALGLNEEIVGVSSYCNYPREAKSKAQVGDFSSPNIEKILSLRPDYVFCTGLEQAPAVIELKRQNLKVYVGDPKDVRELLESIREIGGIINKEKEAAGLTANMESQISEITSRVKLIPGDKKIKVFLEIWHDPLITAGNGSFVDHLITLAGGINIAADTKRPYSIFSPEEVIKRNPDCIIMAYMNSKSASKLAGQRFGWQGINAVKNNRVYDDIDSDLLLRPGPRVVQGLQQLYNRMYQ